jgi:hypothetical protein
LETGIKKFRGGVRLTVEVPSVHIHEAIVIQAAAD